MESKFNILEDKLNDFVRKFYSNRIVIGIILFFLFSVVSFFSAIMVESVAFMSPFTKTTLFYFLLFLSVSILIFFVLIPLGKLLKLIPFISHEEVAKIISNHFPESKDLVINVLQLNSQQNSDILVSAINQKIDLISPLNFSNAIDFKKTSRFLMISLGVLAVLLLFGFLFKSNVSRGTERFLNYSTFYQPENPYTLSLLNDSLYCCYGDDFTIDIKVSGPSILQDVFLKSDLFNVRMNSDSVDCFSYTLKNITSDIEFDFNYLGFVSDKYKVSVIHRPSITGLSAYIHPPSYTGLETVYQDNPGDFTVPYGSQIDWSFIVSHATKWNFYVDSVEQEISQAVEQLHSVTKALKPFDYYFSAVGEGSLAVNSNLFHVNLAPDYSPQIVAVSAVDSSSANGVFFSGHITDDYGFHSLTFNYFDSEKPKEIKSLPLELQKTSSQDFYYFFDFSGLFKSVSYYFEVRDNDAITGFKSAKTPLSVYTTITNEEKQERVDNLNSSIFDKIDEAQRLLRDLNNDLNDFQKNVTSNNQISDWEKQLKLDNLKQKQERLAELFQELSQENQSKNAFENQLSPEMSKELQEKQSQLQQMWDDLMTDEIKELLDKINEMKNSLDEKSLRENISDMKFDFDQMSQQLDRNNELMKMYNIDQKLQNLSKNLDQMASEYKDLSKELGSKDYQKSTDSKSMSQKLNEFNDRFGKNLEDYNRLLDDNDKLGDNKLQISDLEKQFEDLKNQLEYQKSEMQKLDQDMGKPTDSDKNADLSSPDSDKKDGEKSSDLGKKDGGKLSDLDKMDGEKSSDLDKMDGEKSSDSDKKGDKKSSDSDNLDGKKSPDSDMNDKNSSEIDGKKDDMSSEFDKKNGEKSSEFDKSNGEKSSDFDKNNGDKSSDSPNSKPENSNRVGQKGDKNNDKSSQKQRQENISQQMEKSAQEMEDLSRQMQGLDKKNKEKRRQENLSDIRQILDNLVTISFNQESLINQLKQNTSSSYLQNDLLKGQNAIMKDFQLVQDSIYALAKREPKLGHMVFEKIDNVHTYNNKINSSITSGRRGETMSNQQILLTNLNDLSLIFNEIADQMQKESGQHGQESDEEQESPETRNKKQMQQRQQSTQMMKSQQQQLKQNLQKMLEQLQQGAKPSAQQLAEALRQQEMMMQKLQEMQNGQGMSQEQQKLLNEMQRLMEDNKRDIVNKNINKRTVDRHNTLFNKLLELEKADKSQDFDEKRESKQGFDFQNQNQQNLNLKLKDFGVKEFIHTSPVDLNLFYQNKYNDYIQNIE